MNTRPSSIANCLEHATLKMVNQKLPSVLARLKCRKYYQVSLFGCKKFVFVKHKVFLRRIVELSSSVKRFDQNLRGLENLYSLKSFTSLW